MKRIITLFAVLMLGCVLALGIYAEADAPRITMGPQNYSYPEHSVALYTVKATGKNLTAVWYMKWNGTTYNLSDNTNSTEPWEGYAGENYGGNTVDGNTFTWFFGGIESELDGAEIWCTVKDGHNEASSVPARITVSGSVMPPEIVSMPASMTVEKGYPGEARCVARAYGDAQLSFLWYETASGKLEQIQAIMPEENSDSFIFDTSRVGTRYYVCMVSSTDGGYAYSSVLSVTVTEKNTPADTAANGTNVADTGTVTVHVTDTAAVTEANTAKTDKTYDDRDEYEDKDKDKGDGLPLWIVIAVGAGAAAAGVALAFVLAKGKKEND